MIWVFFGVVGVIIIVAILLPQARRRRRARQIDCPMSYLQLLGMSMRGVDIDAVLDAKGRLNDGEIDVPLKHVEVHFLATRELDPVIDGLIEAKKHDVELTWEMACAMHIAGRDIAKDIQAAGEPKEVVTPEIRGQTVDGGEVRVTLKLKLRFVPERAVGAGDETFVIERVCAAAEADIGRAESCAYLTQRPATFARRIFERGLDAGSAFKIEWVDVEEMSGEEAREQEDESADP